MSVDRQSARFFRTNKPYVRWWWFNRPIDKRDVEHQLRWAARQGFGGVEIAWVYPLPQTPPGPRWLSEEWSEEVRAAKAICSGLGQERDRPRHPAPAATSGEVFFKGRDLQRLGKREMEAIRGREIAMIFQEPMTSLNPVLTIGDQIAESIVLHQKRSRREAWERAIEMLDLVKIPDPRLRAKAYPHEMSGGMKQRAMIAMALSSNPSLLIADEPTTAVDVTIQKQILNLLQDLRKEMDLTYLFISHDMGVVRHVSDSIAVMYLGQIVELAESERLCAHPRHPCTKALISSIPVLDPKRRGAFVPLAGETSATAGEAGGCTFRSRCPVATARCAQSPPEPVEVEAGWSVRCFHPD